jgi:hypothetical protein
MNWFWNAHLTVREAYFWAAMALLLPEVLALLSWGGRIVRDRLAAGRKRTVTATVGAVVPGPPAVAAPAPSAAPPPPAVSGAGYVPFFIRLANGADGKWSTSKTAVLLWTYSLGFAFLTWVFWKHNADVGNGKSDVVSWQYLLVLGVPAGSALWAKYNTEQKLATGEKSKPLAGPEANPFAGARDLVSNDEGRADLGDFQYFFFNLILLASFYASFLHTPSDGLPNLPNILLSLTSVSAGAYVVKKTQERDVVPTIRSIVPPSIGAGSPDEATILGLGLVASDGANSDEAQIVLRQGLPPTPPLWSKRLGGLIRDRGVRDGVQRVTFTVPAGTCRVRKSSRHAARRYSWISPSSRSRR